MKCRLKQCKASCCYNVPFENDELERFKDRIVNKVIMQVPIKGKAEMTYTNGNMNENKCPFLRPDFLCNIYNDRPDVCRRMGEINELRCEFRK